MTKLPYLPLYCGDWKKDTQLRKCSAQTRGVWLEALIAMHESDRCGTVSGTEEELARIFSCTLSEVHSAVSELASSGAATVTLRNEVVTLINRRMSREYKARQGNKIRQERHRAPPVCHGENNGAVTQMSQPIISIAISKKKKKHVGERAADPRYGPVVEFFFQTWEKLRGRAFIASEGDFRELKRMLARTKDKRGFGQAELQAAIVRFLSSRDKFHLELGKPLAFWSSHINGFLEIPKATTDTVGLSRDPEPPAGECEKCKGTGRRIVVMDRKYGQPWGTPAWSEETFSNLKKNERFEVILCRCDCKTGQSYLELRTVEEVMADHDAKKSLVN